MSFNSTNAFKLDQELDDCGRQSFKQIRIQEMIDRDELFVGETVSRADQEWSFERMIYFSLSATFGSFLA
jgi:hypothetical protein